MSFTERLQTAKRMRFIIKVYCEQNSRASADQRFTELALVLNWLDGRLTELQSQMDRIDNQHQQHHHHWPEVNAKLQLPDQQVTARACQEPLVR